MCLKIRLRLCDKRFAGCDRRGKIPDLFRYVAGSGLAFQVSQLFRISFDSLGRLFLLYMCSPFHFGDMPHDTLNTL